MPLSRDTAQPNRFRAPRPAPLNLGGGSERSNSVWGEGRQQKRWNWQVEDFGKLEKWFGEIKSVDVARRVAKVQVHGHRPLVVDCEWTVPYCHPEGGFEGVDFIPRDGAQVLVERVQGQFVITGFRMPSAGVETSGDGFVPNHAGFRATDHQPGDFLIGTIDNNHVALTSDGAIRLQSRSLSQMVLEPARGLCRFFIRNFEKFLDGGFITWKSQHATDGEPRSDYHAMFKDTPVSDLDNRVVVQTGKNGDLHKFTVKKRIAPGSKDAFIDVYELHIDKEGNLTIGMLGDAQVTIEGNADVVVKKDVTMQVLGDTDIETQGETFITSGGDVTVTATNINLN